MRALFTITHGGATGEAINSLERQLGYRLPAAYAHLLRETDGAELGTHDTGGDCLRLWPSTQLIEYNSGYNIQRELPQALAIGSDGGDDCILLDRASDPDPDRWRVVRVGFSSLDPEEFVLQGISFEAWAQSEFRLVAASVPEFTNLPWSAR